MATLTYETVYRILTAALETATILGNSAYMEQFEAARKQVAEMGEKYTDIEYQEHKKLLDAFNLIAEAALINAIGVEIDSILAECPNWRPSKTHQQLMKEAAEGDIAGRRIGSYRRILTYMRDNHTQSVQYGKDGFIKHVGCKLIPVAEGMVFRAEEVYSCLPESRGDVKELRELVFSLGDGLLRLVVRAKAGELDYEGYKTLEHFVNQYNELMFEPTASAIRLVAGKIKTTVYSGWDTSYEESIIASARQEETTREALEQLMRRLKWLLSDASIELAKDLKSKAGKMGGDMRTIKNPPVDVKAASISAKEKLQQLLDNVNRTK